MSQAAPNIPADERPIAVDFRHVTKEYRLYGSDKRRVLGLLSKRVPYRTILANNDLSFTIHRGESVAFLGTNGAGKSTALKIVTGVTYPTSGEVVINGRVSALLELNAGFDGNLTGRENIYMRSQLWGFSKEEIAQLEPEIVQFANIGTYIDQPMRTYSSGMRARVGFAFAANINPDILVVDEALSVGDRRFRKKCRRKVRSIIRNNETTVLFVTHSGNSAKHFCDRGIVIEEGHKVYDGPIDDALEFYENRDPDD